MPTKSAVRTTGASEEQIEMAAESRYNFLMTGNQKTKHMTGAGKTWDIDARRKRLIDSFTVHARYLVDTDHRIVSIADLQAIYELAKSSKWAPGNLMLLDRIAGVIGGGE